MEQSRSWEAYSHAASQEIPRRHLRNWKVHYRVQKSPSLVPILSQMNPVQNFSPHFLTIHSTINFPSTPRSSEWSLPFSFPTKICYTLVIPPMRACRSGWLMNLIWTWCHWHLVDPSLDRPTIRSAPCWHFRFLCRTWSQLQFIPKHGLHSYVTRHSFHFYLTALFQLN